MDIYYSNAHVLKWHTTNAPPFPMLVSYFSISNNFKRFAKASKLMLDSGAFSAWRQKQEVDLNSYIEYIHKKKDEFDVIVSLDKIHNNRPCWH